MKAVDGWFAGKEFGRVVQQFASFTKHPPIEKDFGPG